MNNINFWIYFVLLSVQIPSALFAAYEIHNGTYKPMTIGYRLIDAGLAAFLLMILIWKK